MPELIELVRGGAVAQLRLVAKREQRLVTAGCLAGARDRDHLVEAEISALVPARRMRKGAVMADIAAEPGERNEDLARVGDYGAVRGVAPSRRRSREAIDIAIEEPHSLLAREIA